MNVESLDAEKVTEIHHLKAQNGWFYSQLLEISNCFWTFCGCTSLSVWTKPETRDPNSTKLDWEVFFGLNNGLRLIQYEAKLITNCCQLTVFMPWKMTSVLKNSLIKYHTGLMRSYRRLDNTMIPYLLWFSTNMIKYLKII